MTYEDLIDHYGKQARASEQLKIPKQTISCWKKNGIPFERQFRIQMKTKGRLKAVLPPT